VGLIRRTSGAKRDYENIWSYVAKARDKDTADRLLRDFDDKLCLLSDVPGVGISRDDLRPNLRSVPVGKYLLFYRL